MFLKTKIFISERIFLLRIIDLMFLYLGLVFCNHFLGFTYIDLFQSFINKDILTLFVYYFITAQVFQMYDLVDASSRFKTVKNLFVVTLTTCLTYLYTPILTPMLPKNRIEILLFFLCVFFSVFIWRNIYIFTIAKKRFYKNALLICGDDQILESLFDNIYFHSRDNYITGYVKEMKTEGFEGFIDVQNTDLNQVIKQNKIKDLIVSLKGFSNHNAEQLNKKLVQYYAEGITIHSYEDYIEKITFCVPEKHLSDSFYKYFSFSENHQNRLYLFSMRLFDILASILGLLFMITIIPFVLIGNIVGSRGRLFYIQDRVGVEGRCFSIVKFRSMVTTAEVHGEQWASMDDKRITPFGKFLRKTRLDEIPQFWNVLKGEMSLIGPRPERPGFVKELEEKIPLYAIRHSIKPGLTGWAQVMYPYAESFDQQNKKLRYDLYYIKKRGWFIDFKILIKTINTVLYFKGQ